MTDKRVLLTGGTGFIGRQSVRPLLEQGFEVHLVARSARSFSTLGTELTEKCSLHEANLLDCAALEKVVKTISPSHLLHFAWASDARNRWHSPGNLDWSAATLHLARALTESGGKRMVISGTCAEYDWSYETLIEDVVPLMPHTLYGAAKARAHQLLDAAKTSLGLSIAWGHVFYCYGPWEQPGRLVSDVIRQLLRGKIVECTEGLQVRDYLHSSDVGRAFVHVLQSDFDGAINIASGKGIRVRDLVSEAADLLGGRDLVKFGAKPSNPGDPAVLVADISRLKALGFTAEYDVNRGIRETVNWYRS